MRKLTLADVIHRAPAVAQLIDEALAMHKPGAPISETRRVWNLRFKPRLEMLVGKFSNAPRPLDGPYAFAAAADAINHALATGSVPGASQGPSRASVAVESTRSER